jgi:hypothetical protein
VKYLLLINRAQDVWPEPGTPEARALAQAYGEVTGTMAKAGVLIDSAPLQPSSAASVVRVRNGETLITDVPAAELKEYVGGYTVIECAGLDEALEWAARYPAAAEASVAVYPVVPVSAPA